MVKKPNFPKKNNNKTGGPSQQNQDPRRVIVSDDENELKESKHGYFETQGKVIKVESGRYKVSVKLGEQEIIVDAYTSGHLKVNKIRIVQGDVVSLLIPPIFDPESGPKGRIIHRKDAKRF
jgi:translation initiation factor IF-1